MKLVKATLNDFNTFIELYNNLNYSVLYPAYETETKDEAADIHYWDGIDIDEYIKYTFEDFKRDITCPGSYIFFVEDKKEIIGYIQIFRIQGSRYKLADWTLRNNVDQIRNKVWQKILELKSPKMRVLDVCVFDESPAYDWMSKFGFTSTGVRCYMRYEIEAGGK